MSKVNQCDGCQRGLPVKNGIHIDKGSSCLSAFYYMTCTSNRYNEDSQHGDEKEQNQEQETEKA